MGCPTWVIVWQLWTKGTAARAVTSIARVSRAGAGGGGNAGHTCQPELTKPSRIKVVLIGSIVVVERSSVRLLLARNRCNAAGHISTESDQKLVDCSKFLRAADVE